MAAVRMAVMEIGAQDVIMKVYEIAPRKGMQVIDSLRRMVPVGKDTYSAKLAAEAKKFKVINSELQKSINKIFKIIILRNININ